MPSNECNPQKVYAQKSLLNMSEMVLIPQGYNFLNNYYSVETTEIYAYTAMTLGGKDVKSERIQNVFSIPTSSNSLCISNKDSFWSSSKNLIKTRKNYCS